MPVSVRGGRRAFSIAFVTVLAAALLAAGALDAALAQAGPFGAPRPAAPPPGADGVVGWLLAKQAEFYRAMAGMIRAAKAVGSAVVTLFGISFAYGVFHAAGPGHGKAVISSYLVANGETWRRGVVLSFASALLQALVAVAIVGVAAALLGATAKVMGDAVRVIEIVSYALIAVLGARLLWIKGRGFLAALRAAASRPPVAAGAAATHAAHDHAHHHDHHDHHGHDQGHAHAPRHDHDQHDDKHAGHRHAAGCGHAHGPQPQDLAGPGGWRRGLSAIVAVGLRPCSGAILVLVFALAQGMFWAGVGATFMMGLGTAITVAAIATLAVGARSLAARFAASGSGTGLLALRGLEVAAALVVLCFGLLLLAGYIADERLFGV
jgi:nickel/cobalt exporter